MDEVPFVHGAVRLDGKQVSVCLVCYRWRMGFLILLVDWEKAHAVAEHADAIPILEAAS